jgi:phosphoribosylformylglycinamidine synthase
MADCGPPENDADLFKAVEAASRFCLALGISIPVGKDSLSMRTRWEKGGRSVAVGAPVSLVATAHAPVLDVREALTPQLSPRVDTSLILVDLGRGRKRLGASAFAQVTGRHGDPAPDVETPDDVVKLYAAIRIARSRGWILAYHDRSDGGLFAALCEMAFAGHCGLSVNIDMLTIDPYAADWGDFRIRPEQVAVQRAELALRALFNEEIGVVVQVLRSDRDRMLGLLREHGLSVHAHVLGSPNERDTLEIQADAKSLFSMPRATLMQAWSETSQTIARLRDDPDCVDEAARMLAADGAAAAPLSVSITSDPSSTSSRPSTPSTSVGARRPRVAVLREQGVNSQREMAAAFDMAGFDAFDVHMSDLSAGRHRLDDFQVLVACGGFSYGDVLGAGVGWAKSVLFNARLAEHFSRFFNRPDTLSLGVCNGCQMMSQLKSLIPGASAWPRFVRNRSQQYEARFAQVEVMPSPSLLLTGMSGWRLPVAVAHGEGRTEFAATSPRGDAASSARAAVPVLRFVDGEGRPTEQYPLNPNGSAAGLTGFCSDDGRATILMPHPERVFRLAQWSWCPPGLRDSGEDHSPWMRLWLNARAQFD